MKKKSIIIISAVIIISCLGVLFGRNAYAQEPIKVTLSATESASLAPNGDGQWCRCKAGGCYAGCQLSVRSCCAHSKTEPIDCTKYSGNCKP